MADAAAFFANKKKKKKAFKFNANLVDASAVAAKDHIDAPALTTEGETAEEEPLQQQEQNTEWEEMAATTVRKAAAPEVMDMKSLERENATIAEKLRVEETKAQLAAAREGMEREAAKLKEEKEKKEEHSAAPRFAGAAAGLGGSRWVPPHMRGGGGGAPTTIRPGGKLDVEDQELFPDLAAADKILEQKEKEQTPAFQVAKKTPVGGGATWASKPKVKPVAAPAPVEPEVKVEEATKDTEPAAPESAPAAATSALPSVTRKPLKKGKKKDLSTFKPKSAS